MVANRKQTFIYFLLYKTMIAQARAHLFLYVINELENERCDVLFIIIARHMNGSQD